MCGATNPKCWHMVMGWGCTCDIEKQRKTREKKIEQRISDLEKEVAALKSETEQ